MRMHLTLNSKFFTISFCLAGVFFSPFNPPDEEHLFNGESPDATWEQFAVVAADLLERIQASMSYNNSAYASSDEQDDFHDEDDKNNNDDINDERRLDARISRNNFKMWLSQPMT